MKTPYSSTLVLCDLDKLLLGTDGRLPPVLQQVLPLFLGRGGCLTVFTQRSPKAASAVVDTAHFAAPALVCGGTLAYDFAAQRAQPLCTFAGCEETVLTKLPSAVGLGIALQMTDGTTRVLRMSEALERHLRAEHTPFVLSSAADSRGEQVLRILLYQDKKQLPVDALLQKTMGDVARALYAQRIAPDVVALTCAAVTGTAMFNAVCAPGGWTAQNLLVAANCPQMLELVKLAGDSVVPANASPELRLAAARTTVTDRDKGAAAEELYRLVRVEEAEE